ncbi:hypothetical protein CB1_000709017 [Camelus ferus]|nr:hypothetical protein CB1_000709017 [Camelus ferus]
MLSQERASCFLARAPWKSGSEGRPPNQQLKARGGKGCACGASKPLTVDFAEAELGIRSQLRESLAPAKPSGNLSCAALGVLSPNRSRPGPRCEKRPPARSPSVLALGHPCFSGSLFVPGAAVSLLREVVLTSACGFSLDTDARVAIARVLGDWTGAVDSVEIAPPPFKDVATRLVSFLSGFISTKGVITHLTVSGSRDDLLYFLSRLFSRGCVEVVTGACRFRFHITPQGRAEEPPGKIWPDPSVRLVPGPSGRRSARLGASRTPAVVASSTLPLSKAPEFGQQGVRPFPVMQVGRCLPPAHLGDTSGAEAFFSHLVPGAEVTSDLSPVGSRSDEEHQPLLHCVRPALTAFPDRLPPITGTWRGRERVLTQGAAAIHAAESQLPSESVDPTLCGRCPSPPGAPFQESSTPHSLARDAGSTQRSPHDAVPSTPALSPQGTAGPAALAAVSVHLQPDFGFPRRRASRSPCHRCQRTVSVRTSPPFSLSHIIAHDRRGDCSERRTLRPGFVGDPGIRFGSDLPGDPSEGTAAALLPAGPLGLSAVMTLHAVFAKLRFQLPAVVTEPCSSCSRCPGLCVPTGLRPQGKKTGAEEAEAGSQTFPADFKTHLAEPNKEARCGDTLSLFLALLWPWWHLCPLQQPLPDPGTHSPSASAAQTTGNRQQALVPQPTALPAVSLEGPEGRSAPDRSPAGPDT